MKDMAKRQKINVISAGSTGPITSSVTFAGKHYTEEEFAVFEKIASDRGISVYDAINGVDAPTTTNPAAAAASRKRKRRPAPRSTSSAPARGR
jgi:hypothetical protein